MMLMYFTSLNLSRRYLMQVEVEECFCSRCSLIDFPSQDWFYIFQTWIDDASYDTLYILDRLGYYIWAIKVSD